MVQIHTIQPKTKNKRGRRIGRGGKRGTYSGRGIKGQMSRSGHKLRPELRDIIKKIPKLRGYRTPSIMAKACVVSVSYIERLFNTGDQITPRILLDRGAVRREAGRIPSVKILGGGILTKAVTISGCACSASARAAIEKAGGNIVTP